MVEFAAEERGRLGAVRTFRRGWGGDASNFAVACARLGSSCGYITRIGGDEFGRSFLALWEREGVEISRVIVDPEGFTGVYFIAVRDDGGHDFTYYRAGSAASRLQPKDLDPGYLHQARVFHTSSISQAISESTLATVDAAIELVARAGGFVSYDANIRPRLWPLHVARRVVESTFTRARLVFLSTEDAAHLYGEADPHAVIDRVLAFGPQLVVLTQGVQGCLVASEAVRLQIPAWEVEVVDATGAGDAFAAGFVVAWLEGRPLEQAGRFANAAGALTTMGLGAVEPIPHRARVEAFLASQEAGIKQKGV